MPIIKSAKKALKQGLKRKIQNKQRKKKIKSLLKQAESLISEKNIKEVKNILPKVYKSLDKAVKVKIIKKNTANRKKSKIARSIIKIESEKKSK